MVAPARHEDRECKSHGRTPHTLAVVGNGCSLSWQCLRCKSDATKELRERKANGDPVRSWIPQPKQKELKFCAFHFLALSSAGICDDCED